MKRVLVLAYYFPSLGGAGVQRTVKFVKYLREFGYEAIVVTGPETASVGWAPPDPTFVEEVPAGTPVLRIDTPQPRLDDRRSRASRWLSRQTPFDRWWEEGARILGQSVADEVDVVYASMSPFSTAAAAASIARRAGKPWVADLRDPWALDDWTLYPSLLHRRLELRRMGSVLRSADLIVMNTEEARRALLSAIPKFRSRLVAVIPNGWDPDDFTGPPPRRDGSTFRIVYAGYSHAGSSKLRKRALRSFLGGAAAGVLQHGRSHLLLTEALAELGRTHPEVSSRVEVHVAGAGPPGGEPGAGSVRVVHHGYLPHPAAIGLMRSANLLFLPMHDLRRGTRCRTVTGKTYEYLAAGRPILAALPDGDARDLLSGLPGVWLCRPTNKDCMAAAVWEALEGKFTGPTASPDLLARFDRRSLTGDLARVFDEVVASRRPRAGSGLAVKLAS